MLLQKCANAELRREALCQRMLRAHRLLEVIEPMLGHEDQVWEIEKRRHAETLRFLQRRTKRCEQDVDRHWKLARQMRVHRLRDVVCTLLELERLITFQCGGDECLLVER